LGAAFLLGAAFFKERATALDRTELSDRFSFLAMSLVAVLLYAFFSILTSVAVHSLAPPARLVTFLLTTFLVARLGAAFLVVRRVTLRTAFLVATFFLATVLRAGFLPVVFLRAAVLRTGFLAVVFFLGETLRLVVFLTEKPSCIMNAAPIAMLHAWLMVCELYLC
jgi:hypothetical protein